MKKLLCLLMLLQASLAFSGVDCDFNVTFSQVATVILETEQVVQGGINLFRGKDPAGICARYRIFFGKGNAQSYQRIAKNGSFTVSYNLHNNINKAGILKEQPDALSSQEWVDMYSPDRDTNYSVPFFLSLPDLITQNYPPQGIYTDNLVVIAWVVKNDNYFYDDTANLAISISVPSRLDVNLVPVGGQFDLSSTAGVFDFGNLQQNQEMAADLVVRSNVPYQLRMSSQNGGALRQGSFGSVAYNMLVNNNSIGLGNSANMPVTFASGGGTSGNPGDRYTVKVRISESTSSKVAGLYQDVITITAIAN